MRQSQNSRLFDNLGIDLDCCDDDFVELDAICDRFETQWSRSVSLQDLLRIAAKINPSNRLKVLQELSLSDQELRWRDWSEQEFSRFQQEMTPAISQHGLFRAAEYASVLRIPDFCATLESNEWECRCKYGDLPHFKGNRSERYKLDHLPTAEIEVFQRGNTQFHQKFRGDFRIGRQTKQDPAPFNLTDHDPAKLVIADRADPRISRDQARFVFHTNKLLLINNCSLKRPFAVYSPDSSKPPKVVRPGEEVCVQVPTTIDLKQMTLRIDRQ